MGEHAFEFLRPERPPDAKDDLVVVFGLVGVFLVGATGRLVPSLALLGVLLTLGALVGGRYAGYDWGRGRDLDVAKRSARTLAAGLVGMVLGRVVSLLPSPVLSSLGFGVCVALVAHHLAWNLLALAGGY